MSTAASTAGGTGPETEGSESPPFDDVVEVRRDGPLVAVVGGVTGAVALAYLLRAVSSGGVLEWLLALALAGVAAVYLTAFVDARAPLMVLDRHGVRVRRGATWEGVAWPEVDRVEHRPRTSLWRDGRVEVHQIGEAGGAGEAGGRVLGVRLSISTRLIGANWHELGDALGELSGGAVEVRGLGPVPAPSASSQDEDPVPDAPAPVEPTREAVLGRRSDVVVVNPTSTSTAAEVTQVLDAGRILDGGAADPGSADAPQAPAPDVVPDVVPVVGPVLAGARRHLGLSVDQLAERTRIRPHVIEAVEVDDFEPCGGDFYARGHLRTLARVLGVDVAPLLADYDERYADAPIDAKRVFQAELATGSHGSIRGTRGGLNWSVLVASVMAVVLVWSVARLVMDHPTPISHRPVLSGSPSGTDKAALSSARSKVPVVLTAATGGAKVIVRDGAGKVVFDQDLPFMGAADLQVVPPVRISSSDGGLTVALDGGDAAAIGATGDRVERTYVP